jgi:hypothetical protein
MRKFWILSIFSVLFLISAGSLWAEDEEKIEKGQRFILLATTRTGTMQKEIDEAAGNGFRVRMGGPTSGNEMLILMEKLASPPDVYKYKLLATTRTGTMEKELNESGDNGFRMLSQTMIAKKGMVSNEIVVLLEKEPKAAARYQYKLLATSRTSTMEKEIREAEASGFALVGIASRGEHMVIMEKELK